MPNRGYTTLFELDKELAAAFKADCEEFLEEFEKLDSVDFIDFARIWRKKKFSFVFGGQSYALLLKDYIENCYYVVKKFIIFPRSFQTQVGALFLLYGLYYKQPLRKWVKIRITFEEYMKINELLEEMKSRGHFDPLYVFSKLKAEGALLFVAQRKILGPEDRFIKSYEIFYNDTFSVTKVRKVEKKYFELINRSQLVKGLAKTNQDYQDLLEKYSEKCNDLVPMESKIMTDLHAAFNRISSNNQLSEEQKRGTERRNIKNKAMTTKNAVYRAFTSVREQDEKIKEKSVPGVSGTNKKLKTELF